MSCTLQTSALRPHCRPSASCFGTLVNSDILQEYTVLSSAEIKNAKSINAQTIGKRQINDSGLVLSELIRILQFLEWICFLLYVTNPLLNTLNVIDKI